MSEPTEKLASYIVFDNNGLTLEKKGVLDLQHVGFISNIVRKSRKLLNGSDTMNNIEIFYDDSMLMITDNPSSNLAIAVLAESGSK